MTKAYTLKGLDCPHCANKIENSVRGIEGVKTVTVNPITAILNVEFQDDLNSRITPLIKRIVRDHEPDVDVIDRDGKAKAAAETGETGETKRETIKIAVGAAIFTAGLILDKALAAPVHLPRAFFLAAYIILGGEILLRALKNIAKGQIFDENFLMSVAAIGAFAIGEYPEGAGIMLFYQIGEFFQDLAVRKSKKSISALMDIRPDFANLLLEGKTIKVDPETINIGDTILVKPGEKIPLDGEVIDGETMLDTSALTGESIPRRAKVSDEVLSGCINLNGALTLRVTKTFGQSTVAKIIDLVENASNKKAPTENFITKFSRYYTPIVVGLAAIIAIAPPLLGFGVLADWVKRGLIFLVISCPCALVVSIPLGFFGGVGGASRKGILVKGGNYLEALSDLDIVVFDKTGTLTKGTFTVREIKAANNFGAPQLLEYAAKAESYSNHPIALSILKAYGKEIDKAELSDYQEIAGYGISVKVNNDEVLAGNDKLMAARGIAFTPRGEIGAPVYVAVNRVFAGCILIADEVKEDSKTAIAALKALGVRKTIMLTGDNPETAAAIAEELKLDEFHAGLLPGDKVEKLEALMAQKRPKGKLAFAGDGINDAPALARADVGVAMGGLGQDAAIEAADVALMTDEPSKLAEAVGIARFTKRIVWQNIILALGVKGAVMALGALGMASMWEAVFADVGVALLAVLNASRVIRAK